MSGIPSGDVFDSWSKVRFELKSGEQKAAYIRYVSIYLIVVRPGLKIELSPRFYIPPDLLLCLLCIAFFKSYYPWSKHIASIAYCFD
jgi:hypothetical protein